MYMKQFLIIFSIIALAACTSNSGSVYEGELRRIDEGLKHSDEYCRMKLQKISTIENMLQSRGVTTLQQYHIYGQLFLEYQPFQFDKAKEMLEELQREETVETDDIGDSFLIEDEDGELIVDEFEDIDDLGDDYDEDNM